MLCEVVEGNVRVILQTYIVYKVRYFEKEKNH